jgi:hypothetical protein
LSSEELETLREEAIGQLDEQTRKNAEKVDSLELLIKVWMVDIVAERLKAAQCQK